MLKINAALRTTLVASRENPYVIAIDSSSYTAGYNMIAVAVRD